MKVLKSIKRGFALICVMALALSLCACSGKEMFTITREVKLLDPASFTIILESNEVHGEGFRMLRVAEPHAGDEK